jgi:hypothetical protein
VLGGFGGGGGDPGGRLGDGGGIGGAPGGRLGDGGGGASGGSGGAPGGGSVGDRRLSHEPGLKLAVLLHGRQVNGPAASTEPQPSLAQVQFDASVHPRLSSPQLATATTFKANAMLKSVVRTIEPDLHRANARGPPRPARIV